MIHFNKSKKSSKNIHY